MIVDVKETTIVRPTASAQQAVVELSNMDAQHFFAYIDPVFFFHPDGSADFLDEKVIKEALARTLVAFYPLAGRLRKNRETGLLEIECNDEGVVFVEAEADVAMDDLEGFTPGPLLTKLTPSVKLNKDDLSINPLLAVQVTRFRCGSVALAVLILHHVADGSAAIYFVKSWAEVARGLDISIVPVHDRSLLRARHPPKPTFVPSDSIPAEPLKRETATPGSPKAIALLNLTHKQIEALKSKVGRQYSTFVTLVAHVWRCVCMAGGLPGHCESRLAFTVDARSRLNPQLPRGYFGNAVVSTNISARIGDISTDEIDITASKIREKAARVDDDYIRSFMDMITLYQQHLHTMRESDMDIPWSSLTDLVVTSWMRIEALEVDFGWGRPYIMVPSTLAIRNMLVLLSTDTNYDGVAFVIALGEDHMKEFIRLLYEI